MRRQRWITYTNGAPFITSRPVAKPAPWLCPLLGRRFHTKFYISIAPAVAASPHISGTMDSHARWFRLCWVDGGLYSSPYLLFTNLNLDVARYVQYIVSFLTILPRRDIEAIPKNRGEKLVRFIVPLPFSFPSTTGLSIAPTRQGRDTVDRRPFQLSSSSHPSITRMAAVNSSKAEVLHPPNTPHHSQFHKLKKHRFDPVTTHSSLPPNPLAMQT